MVYGAFSPSVFGMLSQSYALNVIGNNIANASTGGFKGSETRFSSLMGNVEGSDTALGGVKPSDFSRIDKQGLLAASDSDYDVGINGRGFFVLSDTFDRSGQTFYGRDGSLQMRTVNDVSVTADDGSAITVRDGYLADKNGYFVLGWERNPDGTFTESADTLAPVRIDPYAFSDIYQPTTTAELLVNLPSGASTGDEETYAVTMVDSAGTSQPVTFNFTKLATANQWEMTATTSEDPVAQVDNITFGGTLEAGDVYEVSINGTTLSYTVTGAEADIDAVRDALINTINAHPGVSASVTASAGTTGELILTADVPGDSFNATGSGIDGGGTADNTAANVTSVANVVSTQTTTPVTMVFDSKGQLVSPTTTTLALGFEGDTTANVTLDLSESIQLGGQFLPVKYDRDGYASANMRSFSFDSQGRLIGQFDDSTTRTLYKLPLAMFANPNGLAEHSGNVYTVTGDSGTANIVGAGQEGAGLFLPNSHELSNVDIASEFTTMLVTQNAYNSSATVFKTLDEMTEVARDLSR
jgi:flagellar hook protein FlgE